MALIAKPDVSKIWADTGSKAAPPDAKIATGWGYEMMPFEWENYLQNRTDWMLNHINQRGIPEWDSLTEYQANRSYVTGSNGVVYIALTTNTGNDPTTDSGTNWVRPFASSAGGGASGDWNINATGLKASTGAPVVIGSTEIARFTANGLAIGATSSAYNLYVYQPSAAVSAMLASGSAGDATFYLNVNGVSQNWIRSQRSTGDLIFATADTAQMRLTYTGQLLLGVAASTFPVDIQRTTNQAFLRVRNSTSGIETKLGTTANSGYIDVGNADLAFLRNGTEVGRFNGTNLGIGVVNAAFAANNGGLHVHNGTASQGAQIRLTNAGTGATNTDGLMFQIDTAGNSYVYNHEANSLIFGTANDEAFRLNASRNLLVGKSTGLGYKVDILGQIGVEDGTIRAGWGAGMFTAGTMGFGTTSNHRLTLGTNGVARAAFSGSGQFTVGRLEPASGGMVEVGGAFVFNPSTVAPTIGTNGDVAFQRVSDTQLKVLMRGSDGTTRNVNLPLDVSSPALATSTDIDGLKDIPSNPQTTSYTLALSDRGKSVDTTAGVVIPANSAVAFPVGSVVMVTNTSASNINISINTDTLRLAGTGSTGTRVLAQYGVATLRKISSTVWMITGAGVT